MQRKIIFVHGFGVRKDARGIFTDIQKYFFNDESLKDIVCIFTDLNIVSEGSNDLTLNPLSVQAKILQDVYDKEKEGSEIFLVCHSQGCVVASLCDFPNPSKIFFLAPPNNNDLDKTIERFSKRPNSVFNLDDDSIFTRSDNSRTTVPKEYWAERKSMNYLEMYRGLSFKVSRDNLIIVLAKDDEVVVNDSVGELEEIGKVCWVEGNHNFDGHRAELSRIIKDYLG